MDAVRYDLAVDAGRGEKTILGSFKLRLYRSSVFFADIGHVRWFERRFRERLGDFDVGLIGPCLLAGHRGNGRLSQSEVIKRSPCIAVQQERIADLCNS